MCPAWLPADSPSLQGRGWGVLDGVNYVDHTCRMTGPLLTAQETYKIAKHPTVQNEIAVLGSFFRVQPQGMLDIVGLTLSRTLSPVTAHSHYGSVLHVVNGGHATCLGCVFVDHMSAAAEHRHTGRQVNALAALALEGRRVMSCFAQLEGYQKDTWRALWPFHAAGMAGVSL